MQVAANLTTQDLFLSLTSTAINTISHSNINNKNEKASIHSNHTINNLSSTEIKQNIQLSNVALGLFLSLFCIITIFGNCLVIFAIVQERYLKSATYYYMASLACADLFVGLIVMPFAIVQVIFGDYWPFGTTCCDLWHSVDICASTASILDLCVIALDRYSAITNPISYHQTFFVKRWPYLLAAVWLCSGLISFPPIQYWRLGRKDDIHRCNFPNGTYYVLSSSLISFYIPLFVMIFVYIIIYRAAVKQLRAFKTGVKVASPTTKKKKKGLKNDDTIENTPPDVCLRIHRGKYHGIQTLTRDSSSTINHLETTRSSNTDERINLTAKHIKKSISGAFLNDHQNSSLSRFSMPTLIDPTTNMTTNDHHQLTINNSNTKKGHSQDTISTYETPRPSKTNPPPPPLNSSAGTSLGKRLTKFSKEQKATITLAYVMGIFVLCWLPFFIYHPLTAVAKLFINTKKPLSSFKKFLIGNDLVFQMFTWFGFVNSSVNPIIYAYSSREFRRAFIKYLCRCFPMRVRNLMMSYHNLHLLRYRRAPESNVSKENAESGSDNNNNINSNNPNKQHTVPSSASTTTILANIHNKKHQCRPNKSSKHVKTIDKPKHSRIWFLANCCRTKTIQQQEPNDKRSSSTTSSKTTSPNTVLVDYCTYHDVAVSRVTCL